MECTHCAAPVGEEDKFCRKCGRRIHVEAASSRREAVKRSAIDIAKEGRIVADQAVKLGKKGLKTDAGKSVAACAVIGAAIGVPVPFVGPLTGAIIGGAIGFVRKI